MKTRTQRIYSSKYFVISKRNHKYSPRETDPAAQHLSCAVQFSSSQNKPRYSATSSASFRYMLITSISLSKWLIKKSRLCFYANGTPQVFLLIYGGEGMGKSIAYKNFPTGKAYFLSIPLKRKTESMTLWLLHCKADTPVLVAWLTFHKHRVQKASWFVFKVSRTQFTYISARTSRCCLVLSSHIVTRNALRKNSLGDTVHD